MLNYRDLEDRERERHRLRRKFAREDQAAERIDRWKQEDIAHYGAGGVFKRNVMFWGGGGVALGIAGLLFALVSGQGFQQGWDTFLLFSIIGGMIGVLKGATNAMGG